jgi:type III pantothenate kinase
MDKLSPDCLDIDAGNTRIKWRLSRGGELLLSGAADGVKTELRASISPYSASIKRCRLSSVAGVVVDADIETLLKELCGIRVERAASRALSCGVENTYEPPESLGVDRWLAVVAAYSRYGRACVVVDCGSAITVDLIDEGGRYLGGYIVPGLGLMRRALFQDTDAVKVEPACVSNLGVGRNTRNAVNHGMYQMIVGLLERAQAELQVGGQEPLLVLTGGDALRLKPFLPEAAEFHDGLVFEGLARVLP